MRSSWLYFAMRSERDSEPVLIWPALVPTAMSAMIAVLGLAGAMRDRPPCSARGSPSSIAANVSVQRADLVDLDQDRVGDALRRCPASGSCVLVTNRSSPTSCTLLPSRSVRSFQPSQSSSAMPSSMLTIGYLSHHVGEQVDELLRRAARGPPPRARTRRPCRTRSRAVERERDVACPACSPPCRSPRPGAAARPRSIGRSRREAALVADRGRHALRVDQIFFSVWNTSAP